MAPLLILAVLSAGCGEATTAPPSTDGTGIPLLLPLPPGDPPADADWLVGVGTVLDDGDRAEPWLGGVAESLPAVRWRESRRLRLGRNLGPGVARRHHLDRRYVLTGTYEGNRFRLTKPPVTEKEYQGPRPTWSDDSNRLRTPCPEPAGGWAPVNPARTTDQTLNQVASEPNRLDGFGDLWWDQSINDSDDEFAMSDPARLVVNVRVTGNVRAAETALREVWGGALWVTQAKRTQAELSKIQREVNDTPGMLFSDAGRDVMVRWRLSALRRPPRDPRRRVASAAHGRGVRRAWYRSTQRWCRCDTSSTEGVQTRRLDPGETCRRADSGLWSGLVLEVEADRVDAVALARGSAVAVVEHVPEVRATVGATHLDPLHPERLVLDVLHPVLGKRRIE